MGENFKSFHAEEFQVIYIDSQPSRKGSMTSHPLFFLPIQTYLCFEAQIRLYLFYILLNLFTLPHQPLIFFFLNIKYKLL